MTTNLNKWLPTKFAICTSGHCSTPETKNCPRWSRCGWIEKRSSPAPSVDWARNSPTLQQQACARRHLLLRIIDLVFSAVAEAAPERKALLTSKNKDGGIFVVVAGETSGLQLEETGPRIAAILGGRGGGRGTIFQGKTSSLENRDEALRILSEA